jgi:hypothetical protein
MYYFRNPAAQISYVETGYIRVDWGALNASASEVKGIYEHILQAMRRYHAKSLLCVYAQATPLTKEVEAWLLHDWIPRAAHEVDYQRCAIVEPKRTASQAGSCTKTLCNGEPLEYAFFTSATEAEPWLLNRTLVPHLA